MISYTSAHEQWLPVPGYEGLYEISDSGRVRSVDRWYVRADSRKYFVKGKTLQQCVTSNGYLTVTLRKNGKTRREYMHRLVLYAFYHFFLGTRRSEEHTSELQSRFDLVCRLLLEKKNR